MLESMFKSGMSVARINASFADEAEIKRVGKQVRKLSPKIALMLDTKGHKIRVSDFNEPIHLKPGDTFVLDSQKNEKYIWVTYKNLYKQVHDGTLILLDDGKIELEVIGKDGTRIITKVKSGGILTRSKTLNVIGAHFDFPSLTEKDKKDIKIAMKAGYDFVSGSFIRNREDVQAIKQIIKKSDVKVISKIECAEGVENIDEIIEESFGIMVARGDLGVELPFEETPLLQKEIIAKCNAMGKPVIVATQMLESMIKNPRPTRAEVSDITNAVLDGSDAVMLSAETSTGEYPSQCVSVMTRVARYVESRIDPKVIKKPAAAKPTTNAIAEGVIDICDQLPVTKIVVATSSGTTARTIARHRPKQPIVAFTKDEFGMHGLSLTKGVVAEVLPSMKATRGSAVVELVKAAYKEGYVSKSDMVVVVAGANVESLSATGMLEVVEVGEVI